MAGLQSSEGRVMINSVVWAQYISVRDSHVAIANAAAVHWRWVAKISKQLVTEMLNTTTASCTNHKSVIL